MRLRMNKIMRLIDEQQEHINKQQELLRRGKELIESLTAENEQLHKSYEAAQKLWNEDCSDIVTLKQENEGLKAALHELYGSAIPEQEYHNPADVAELDHYKQEIERLKGLVGCGCGICLAHNNMRCPKLPQEQVNTNTVTITDHGEYTLIYGEEAGDVK